MTRLQEAKEKSIIDYLASIGHEPVHETGSNAIYYSPLRSEGVPSFSVSIPKNTFRDFGKAMKPSDIMDLVMEMESCTLNEAIEIILGDRKGGAIQTHDPKPFKEIKEFVHISSVDRITDQRLYSYLSERNISLYTASKWLKQLTITFPASKVNPDKEHIVLGFETDSGGYEMRNAYLKVCNSPKNIKTIHGDPDKVVIFEGFFDYLSYLEMRNTIQVPETVIVLNSTSFMPVVAVMLEGKSVYGYFDNDKAGDDCFKTLQEEGISYMDCRYHYLDYNDLNEMWRLESV